MVNYFGILLVLISASHLIAAQADDDQDCCLCNHCESPAYERLDMFLLGLHHEQQTTCASLAADLEITQHQNSEQCQTARKLYSEACCTEGFNDVQAMEEQTLKPPRIGSVARSLFGSSSVMCADNRYSSNDVEFDTPGGACSCPVCRSGAEPDAWMGATVYVPGRGTYQGSCSYLNSVGKGGYLTNGFCNIFQISLSSCCVAPDNAAWSAYRGGS